MKVKELIEKLAKLNPELEVYYRDPGCGCCSAGDEEYDREPAEVVHDRKTSRFVLDDPDHPDPLKRRAGQWVNEDISKRVVKL